MEIPSTHIDLIEAYLSGSMKDADRQAFEQRLKQEEDIALHLAQYQEARDAIDLFAESKLKADFKQQYFAETGKQTESAVVKPLFRRRVWYAVAATVLILVLAAIGYQRFNAGPVDPGSLYAMNYELPPLTVRGDTNLDLLEQASALMTQGDFMNALLQLESLEQDTAFDRKDAVYYRMGLCQMELNAFDHAVDAFSQIDPNSSLVHQGRWFAALSFLQLNDIVSAREQLELVLANSRDKDLKAKSTQLMEQIP